MAIRSTLVLALIIGIVGAVDDLEETPTQLGVGSSNLVLVPKKGKTTEKHPTHANNSILLFCGAKQAPDDDDYLEIDRVEWSKHPNPDSTNGAEAEEVRKFKSLESTSNYTVPLNISNPFVNASGKYRCKLWKGSTLKATRDLEVYMRPVFVQGDDQRFKIIEKGAPFELDGHGYTVTEGEAVTLSCGALGYPEPDYQWERDGKLLESGERLSIEKSVLNITGVTEQDRGTYKCIASNFFNEEAYNSSVTFNVRMRSKMAWVWPLLAIVAIAVLLVAIIMIFEYRRKKIEKSEREAQKLEPEEED